MEENVPLSRLTTLGVGGPARWLAHARSEEDVREAIAFASEGRLPLFVLGGGSNLLAADEGFPGLILKVEITGVVRKVLQDSVLYEVGAGEDWDGLVEKTVAAGDAGVQCLSGIPGTTGGVPVQNVGAYGQEASQTVRSVRAVSVLTGEAVEFAAADCGFAYRRSRFNAEDAGKFVITGVSLALQATKKVEVLYADLKQYFQERKIAQPTLPEVRQAVLSVRLRKGMVLVPPHSDDHSAGSFFKNPVVADSVAEAVRQAVAPAAVAAWPAAPGRTKLSAAWLVEHAGFGKGYGMGRAGVSSRHSLALVNRGGASCGEILALRDAIVAGVRDAFGVTLEMEPVRLTPGSGVVPPPH